MRILIIGGGGMLGHQLFLSLREHHEVKVTLRGSVEAYSSLGLFSAESSFPDVDITDSDAVERVLAAFRPEAVINSAAIIKHRRNGGEVLPCLLANAVFPHRLALMTKLAGSRLIQLSTDCVFSGKAGHYTEDSSPDPVDVYGQTKLLGEVVGDHCLTLRTSFIGRELRHKTGLIEWYLAQKGTIKGFAGAIYSGLTTLAFARLMHQVLVDFPSLSGLWHVASAPISKYDLLSQLTEALGRRDIEVQREAAYRCDRSLDASRFNREVGYAPPAWSEMIGELAADITSGRVFR